jgi:hypothetical protein
MFTRDKPRAAQDLDQLFGDPWEVGRISDAPNPEERQAWAEQYDRGIEIKLAQAGVLPGHPAYDELYTAAVNGDLTNSVEGLTHGHELPMRGRDAIAYCGEDQWRAAKEQSARGDALLNEYYRRNPDLRDREGLHEAVAAAQEYYDERGLVPSQNFSEFLNTTSSFHRGGVGPIHDHGRTAGISASGGAASGWEEKPDQHPDNDGGMVGELRSLQRARGW